MRRVTVVYEALCLGTYGDGSHRLLSLDGRDVFMAPVEAQVTTTGDVED